MTDLVSYPTWLALVFIFWMIITLPQNPRRTADIASLEIIRRITPK